MGDRKNKNRQGSKSIVRVSVQVADVSGTKQGGKGHSNSTVNMGAAQKSSSGRGNSQTATTVRMMATTHQNRPQQKHQPSKNHAPQQHRPQQNKVVHKAPSAIPKRNSPSTMSGQNISVNINLASLMARQLQIPKNQHQHPQQPAAGGNQRKPSQQNPKNTGGYWSGLFQMFT